jgi:signal transduction histidine kinase
MFFFYPAIMIAFFIYRGTSRKHTVILLLLLYTLSFFVSLYYPHIIVDRSPLEPLFYLERTVSFLLSLFLTSYLLFRILHHYKLINKKAKQSEKEKSDFSETMSHMIRTPLNSIEGFSNLLLDDDFTNEEKQEFIYTINKNAKTLKYLIKDLTDLAMIQNKSLQLFPISFSVTQLLSTLEKKASQLLMANIYKLDFITEVSSDVKETIIFQDYKRLIQVLWHILQNAFKYTKNGHVRLVIYTSQNYLVTQIYDTGIGMTKEEQDQVFLLIKKQNIGFNEVEEGTGIGLNIAQGIIKEMNGKIAISSKQNEGTLVTTSVPKTF